MASASRRKACAPLARPDRTALRRRIVALADEDRTTPGSGSGPDTRGDLTWSPLCLRLHAGVSTLSVTDLYSTGVVSARVCRAKALTRLVAAVVVVLAAAGCGRSGDSVVAEGADQAPLPTLPPAESRHPELFGPNGCLETGGGATDCSTTGSDLDEAAASPDAGANVDRQLLGFRGPGYLPRPSSGEVVIVERTVRLGSGAEWSASLLVRNETAAPIAWASARATLIGDSGEAITAVEGRTTVTPLRPGEPAPLTLTSGTPVDQVREVRWSTKAGPIGSDSTAPSRSFEIITYWVRPYGDPEPVDLYLYADGATGSHPYLLFGSVTNHGEPVDAATVTAAWQDEGGQVVWTAQADVSCIAGRLDPNASCDFLVVVDDPDAAPMLANAGVVLWADGS